MRTRFIRRIRGLWIAAVVAAASLLAPSALYAQADGGPPVIPRDFVGPLSHPRYEEGGFYSALEFLYIKQRNPIGSQTVAQRGFVDVDGSITGVPGTFVGSGATALNTHQLNGPMEFNPGFNLTLGYRFQDGLAVQATWWHLADMRRSALASVIAPNYANGLNLENTVMFSPVVNLTPEFAGNDRNLKVGRDGATYGIWNAASIEQIIFIQHFDLVELMARIPTYETDNYRGYFLFGPRGIALWENFRWRTTDVSDTGSAGDNTIGIYTNIVSNRLYGLVCGAGNEFRLGDTPIGTFSIFADVDVGLYADFVKGRAGYQLADRSIAYKYSRNMFTMVPGFDLKTGFNWYIYEAITIRLDYNFLGLINTVASPNPIDFNVGSVHPSYPNGQWRYFTGLGFGISFVF